MLIYGIQHLQGTSYRGDKSTPDYPINKLSVNKQIDSLVITGSGIKNNSFYNLPELTESNLDLGNLILNTTLTGTPCPGIPTIIDTRDGKVYNTVQIGDQCWLKENLDVGTRINGNTSSTNNSTIEKYCYGDDDANCALYGGLYQWNVAMQYVTTPGTKGICPTGWHIPTKTEFQTLATAVNNDGNALKEIGQGTGSGVGTNTSGFSTLLAGYHHIDGYFYYLGYGTLFWSSTEYNASGANALHLKYYSSNILFYIYTKELGFSVRCLKN